MNSIGLLLKRAIHFSIVACTLPFMLLAAVFPSRERKQLVWCPIPIINNKYWSNAMKQAGWDSKTLMKDYYAINRREDFDLYFDDLVPRWIIPHFLRRGLEAQFALLYILRHASVVHIPFSGGPLGHMPFWWVEAPLFRLAGIRTIVISYGADAYMYSCIIDPSLRNGLLISYPTAARREPDIARRVKYWNRYADVVLTGLMIDGMGRWDCVVYNLGAIDTSQWSPKVCYSMNDGENGAVKVIHTPNHRGAKGTEFLINAVQTLQSEGLQVELILLEKVANDKVRALMQEADILAEQFILGHGLSAIEGMASGLVVMSNLENETYTRVFRRYSFLNECPIVSTSPETLERNLRVLATCPELREELGRAGRQYVEKYHSYKTAQYLFGSIYDRILLGKEVDLINLFHPLKSEYNGRKPIVKHPLIENHLPEQYLKPNGYSQGTCESIA
jgi:glycosyltransferase involved in cell wall biosynthesis